MKIAVFTDIYAPWSDGGIAASVKAQKDELEKLGHEVTIFCPGFQPHEKNVIVVPSFKHLKINGAVLARSPKKIVEYIHSVAPSLSEYDLVHVHYEAGCSIAGVMLAQEYGLPVVQTMHGREDMAIALNVSHPWKYLVATVLNGLHKKYLPHSIKVKKDKFQAPTRARAKMWELMVNQANQADVVITPSKHFAYKVEHYGVEKPIEVVSNGVADELVQEEFAERQLEDGAVLKMIWNSRLSKEKRVMPFLQAVAMLRRPYLVYMYGEGNQYRKAQRFAKRHGLKIKFYGKRKRDKIIERMKEAHLAIMASYNFDTQGMTLLEAEATGLPVMFCDPEMMEVVPAGSYVIAGGPEAAAMAIALENLSAEQVAKMSRKMLKHRAEVLQPVQAQKLLKVYKNVVRKNRQ